jgi:Fic family protein
MENFIEAFTQRYLPRQEVLYRVTPRENIDVFWPQLLEARKKYAVKTPLRDKRESEFWLALIPELTESISYVEDIGKHELFAMVQGELANSIILDAILDEAFYSSVIEGAFSTKQRTAELIATQSQPANKSEQMIFNNYLALQFVLENLDKPLDEEMVLSIYRLVTKDTLEAADVVERYRNGPVYVWDAGLNKAIYEGPAFSDVQAMMTRLIEFIHDDTDGIHPVIKACILHFYFVYIHPFFDGNGRTARAISYMYLLQRGYGFFKFFSISSIVREQKAKYYKAILDAENPEADLTYFVLYYTSMVLDSIKLVIGRFEKEFHKKIIQDCVGKLGIALSSRQSKSVDSLIKGKKTLLTVEDYTKRFKVAYETGRSDLNQLVDFGLLTKTKTGKKFVYKLVSAEALYKRCKFNL